MSTRGNITIKYKKDVYKFETTGACLEDFVPPILKLFDSRYTPTVSDLTDCFGEMGLGHIGNPTYYYDIDLNKKELKVYRTQSYWVTAPSDWKEKGWKGCYEKYPGGPIGFSDTRKGKRIDISNFIFEHKL